MTLTSDARARAGAGGGGAAARPAKQPEPRALVAVVALVVLAGVAFRCYTKSDLWLDEALSVNIARLPLRDIPHWLRHDGAPPLYYMLLHVWSGVFGTSNVAVRSLSGVLGVVSLPLAYATGKRLGGRTTAWSAVLVLALNPYAIRYSTEARMYMLEVVLAFAGILAVQRIFERPSVGRLAVLAVLTAVLVYTQYWGFYLVAAAALFLLGTARVVPELRGAAIRSIVAIGVGVVTFAPWIPTFLYQAKHTGTPWGKAVLPPVPLGVSVADFAGGPQNEGYLLQFLLIALVLLGVFGAATNGRHIDIDLWTRPVVRWIAAVGFGTLVIGASAAYLGHSAFQSRYASIMFPFFVLVAAQGVSCFADFRVRALVLAVVVALGFVGSARNLVTDRTEATQVAAILNRDALPGDLVLYCPDQVGPAVHRLLRSGLDEATYPRFGAPALVDWVDYKDVLAAHKPAAFAREALARAGSHTIWLVWAPGYITHVGTCESIAATLGKTRPLQNRLAPDPDIFEKPGLQAFPAH